jgi:hypothetical protein
MVEPFFRPWIGLHHKVSLEQYAPPQQRSDKSTPAKIDQMFRLREAGST